MTTYAGHLSDVKIDDSGLVTVGSVRQQSKADDNAVGESTTKSSGTTREFDGLAFLKGHQMSFSGLTSDAAGFAKLWATAAHVSDVSVNMQFEMSEGAIFTGVCAVTNLTIEGGTAEAHEAFSCDVVAVLNLVVT